MQSLNFAGPSDSAWQRLRLLRRELLRHSINTYGIKRLNHNIAVFAVTALHMLTDKTALFYPEKERNRYETNHSPPPVSAVLNSVHGW